MTADELLIELVEETSCLEADDRFPHREAWVCRYCGRPAVRTATSQTVTHDDRCLWLRIVTYLGR